MNYVTIKHQQLKVSPVQPKVSPVQPKVSPGETNNITLYTCNNCNKSYKKQWILNRHIKICKGVKDPLLCNYCNNIFTYKSSKSKHLKICKVKNTALCAFGDACTNRHPGREETTLLLERYGSISILMYKI